MKKTIFLFFATLLCATSAWAVSINKTGTGYIYLDRYNMSNEWNTNNVYLVWRYDDSAYRALMSQIDNTKLSLWYGGTGWDNITHIGFMCGNWGDSNSDTWSNITDWAIDYTNSFNDNFGFNAGNYSVVSATGSTKNWAISPVYIGSNASSMNKTITVKAKTSNDGKNYAEATSPGTLTATSFKFTAYNSCKSETSLNSGIITCGYTATTKLTAQTNVSGYVFMGWYNKDGNLQTENATLTIYPTADAEYYAYYKKPLTYTVTVPVGTEECYIAGEMNGWGFTKMTNKGNNVFTITLDKATATQGYKYTCGNDWKYVEVKKDGEKLDNRTYTTNDNVVKWAVAPGLHLVGDMNDWNVFAGKLEGTTTASLTLNLSKGNYGFKITSDGEWLGNDGTMKRGETSVEEGGWVFTSKENNCTLVADVTGDYVFTWNTNQKKLTVKYPNIYTITVTAENGTVEGTGEYVEGETVTLTATANDGYKFVNWTKEGVEVSTNAKYEFTATEDVELVANFEKETYIRTVRADYYGTICLPFGSSEYSGAEFYEVSYVIVGKGLWLDQLEDNTQLEAGKPYIFKATADQLVVVSDGKTAANPVAGANGLTGTFTDIAANGALVGHYIIAENKVWVAGDGATLPANRAYINAEDVPTTPQAQLPGRRRVCMGENATTDIDNITNRENTTIKVIENGQLIIIRNGKKFNAQGQKL